MRTGYLLEYKGKIYITTNKRVHDTYIASVLNSTSKEVLVLTGHLEEAELIKELTQIEQADSNAARDLILPPIPSTGVIGKREVKLPDMPMIGKEG